jgi:hypothetical protein
MERENELLKSIIKEIAKKEGAIKIEYDGKEYIITDFGIYKITYEPCRCFCHENTRNNLPCGVCINHCYYSSLMELVISL